MNTVFLPLATTIWENPCGKLGKSVLGLRCSFINKLADSRRRPNDFDLDAQRRAAAGQMVPGTEFSSLALALDDECPANYRVRLVGSVPMSRNVSVLRYAYHS